VPFAQNPRQCIGFGRANQYDVIADLLLEFVRAAGGDDTPVIDGMKRIRDVFPNACELVYERNDRAPEIKSLAGRAPAVASPVEVIGDFLEHVREDQISQNELAVVASALGRLREMEDVQ
jgi:exonuclease SbcD